MQKHLERQDGVAKVTVSLEEGLVTIVAREDGILDPARILQATYDSGVSVAEMTMTARGRLVLDPKQGLLFRLAPNQLLPMAPNALADQIKELAGTSTEVTLRARLYQKPAGKQKQKQPGPVRVEILEVLKKE